MFTVKQAAIELGISPSVLYQLVSSRKIGCYRLGTGRGGIRFNDEQLCAYLESCRVDPHTAPVFKPKLRHLRLAVSSSQ